MDKFIIYVLLLFTFQGINGQNICGDFKSYEDSQDWIKHVMSLSSEARKANIIDRIICEQKSKQDDIDFRLSIIFGGYRFFTASEIPPERIKILKLIPASSYRVAYSFCESKNLFLERCNLGFVFIDDFQGCILNEIHQLKVIRVKRRRGGKIILKIASEIEDTIEFKLSGFLNQSGTTFNTQRILKKGNNRIVMWRSSLQYIEVHLNGQKLLILI